MHRILIVEDDEEIAGLLRRYLVKEGMECVIVEQGSQVIPVLESQGPFQLVILDLMLPEVDGLEILRRIRTQSHVPVMIITAKDGETDKIIGLGIGADDYMIKPFSIFEVTARVKALLRRYVDFTAEATHLSSYSSVAISPIITFGEITIDPEQCQVSRNGQDIGLTAKEFQIVHLLASYPNKVFTRENLYFQVWGEEYIGGENTLSVHIRRLREKIENDPSMPKHIVTVWGMGYKWGNP
jgi:DNA-binding response OmpR family regulator